MLEHSEEEHLLTFDTVKQIGLASLDLAGMGRLVRVKMNSTK